MSDVASRALADRTVHIERVCLPYIRQSSMFCTKFSDSIFLTSFVRFTQYLLFSAFVQHSEANDVCELSLPISTVVALLLDFFLSG